MRTARSILCDIVDVMKDVQDFERSAAQATPHVQELLERPDLLTFGVERTGFHVDRSSWLYYDPDIAVTIAEVKAGTVIPTHNHGTWEIVAPYRGRLTYIGYERVDDMAAPGKATLKPVDERVMVSGDVAICPPPPHDVHGWTVEAPTYLLAVVGPGIKTRREYYDPQAATYLEKEAQWPGLLG